MRVEFDEALSGLTSGRSEGCRILLAVSGGIDSIVMADLFLQSSLKIPFSVAHVNFNLRAEESDADEAFVRQWCSDNGVECFVKGVDTLQYASDKSVSVEMAARDLRYDWFAQLVREKGFEYVAVAHNLNDRAETMVLNLLRGTGLKGLSGIKAVNGKIIRPLLNFTRESIEQYASSRGLKHREDATNAESEFSRNRIRNEVFPHFKSINPSFLTTFKEDMDRVGEAWQILEEFYQARAGELYGWREDVMAVDISQLVINGHTGFWLYRLFDQFGFNSSQLSRIEASLDGQSGKRFYSKTHIVVKDRDYLKVYPIASQTAEVKVEVMEKPVGFNPKEAPAGVLYVDADKVNPPFSFRSPVDGDRFKPLGMKGEKLLSDFFTDLKLDVEQKRREVVITMKNEKGAEQIVAIAGRRIDDRFKVLPETAAIIRFSL